MEKFVSQLNGIFVLSKEIIKNSNEDNFYCGYKNDAAMIAVFDGCGGLGSQKYKCFQEHTGAYMASRIVSGAVHDWFHDYYDKEWKSESDFVQSIKTYIDNGYAVCKKYAEKNTLIRGTMVRDFPTTAAIAYVHRTLSEIELYTIWVGDSRIYLLDDCGLAQLSVDDTDVDSALSNLYSDGALNNVLSSDGNYVLHCIHMRLHKPVQIIVATDGCFGYVPTPMEFEKLLLDCIIHSRSQESLKQELYKTFTTYAGDDFSLGWISLMYDSYSQIRDLCKKRKRELTQKYLRYDKDTQVLDTWERYRKNYERYI